MPPRKKAADDGAEAATERVIKTQPVQVSAQHYERLSKVSERTGISRAQLVDWLIDRMTIADMVSALKAEKIKRRPVGRAKQRYHS